MSKKLAAVLTAAVLVLAGGAAGAVTADNLWGDATSKPPCSEWRDRVFDKKTGAFLPFTSAEDDGWSFSAARGLLDEGGCEWVFRPSGDKENTYWQRKYELAAYYDLLAVQYGAERGRHAHMTTFVDVANRTDYFTYDQHCEEEGGEVWQDAVGTEWCNFGSDDFDFDEDDYVIRGPIG